MVRFRGDWRHQSKFAKSVGRGRMAYQVVSDGPVDVLVTRTAMFPIDLMWDEPRLAHFLNRMSSFSPTHLV